MPEIIWEYGSFAEHFEDIKELSRQCWTEHAANEIGELHFDLHEEQLLNCEAMGILGVMVGLEPETRDVVGIYLTIIAPHTFMQHITMSSELIWYIRRDYMSRETVYDFFRAVKKANAEWGADYIGIEIQNIGNVNRAQETLEREGFTLTSLAFMQMMEE